MSVCMERQYSVNKEDIAVVVPVYLSTLSDKERISFERCLKLLSGYNVVVIKPEHLKLEEFIERYRIIRVENFPDECFSSLRAYNKLVLTEEFYRRFQDYVYILIYQLDAYVFRDELLDWANRGYDYIGAPWIPAKKHYRSTLGRFRLLTQRFVYKLFGCQSFKSPKFYAYQVGNGGLSLRKVDKMIALTAYYKEKITRLLDDDEEFYPEDVFLLLEITDKKYRLQKPSFSEALKFSMDERPELAYEYNNRSLPFGCHAWYDEKYYPFWSLIIKK